MTEITPERFERIVSPNVGRPEKLWGAPAIAAALGVSVATVYRFASETDCPITRPGGRYFAYRSELENWLRSAA
jgi:excisionase family DNA binding protein